MFDKFYKHAFLLLATLILVVNGVVLGKVMFNQGETISRITLTERELALPYRNSKENSGTQLRLQYRILSEEIDSYTGNASWNSPAWLNRQKMQSLGFSVEDEKVRDKKSYQAPVTKERFIALEYDGNQYQQMLKNVQQWHKEESNQGRTDQQVLNKRLDVEKYQASRLFVIDAANSIKELMQKYGNQKNVIYAKAVISNKSYMSYRDEQQNDGAGYIDRLSVASVNVQQPFSEALKALPEKSFDKVIKPRFKVDLTIGKGLEPFINDVKLIEEH